MPSPRTGWSIVAVAVAVVAVVVAVRVVGDDAAPTRSRSHEPLTTITPAAPSTMPAQADDAQRKASLRSGVQVIGAFLDAWRRDGAGAASEAYAVPEQQSISDVGVARLRSGSVLAATMSSWESPDQFTLEVSLDLHFDGDPLAWTEGTNDRFVTFTRTGDALRLAFATSP